MASKRFQTSNCVDFHCESARQMHIMYLRLYCVACGRARKKGGSEPPASSRHRYWTDAGRGGQFCRNRGRGRREIHLRRVCTSGCVWSLKAYNSWVVFHIWAHSVGSGCEWYIWYINGLVLNHAHRHTKKPYLADSHLLYSSLALTYDYFP